MANTDPTGYISIPPDLTRGFSWKQPVVCATTANITLSGTQTIDGRAVVAGERVLVKDQTIGSQNGLLVCATGAWIRAFDMDQDLTTAVAIEEVMGAAVYVIAGTVNGGTFWRTTNTTAPTLGTTTITFVQFGGSGSGTVTSVALTVPAEFSVSGSPITTSGTLAVSKANESANAVWAGPTSGSAAQPTFRALVAADIPAGVGQTDHEHIDNVIYSGDGSTAAFELPAAPFDAYSVQAFVAGVRVPQTLSGTMLTTMTFDTAPASGTDNVVVDITAVAV